METVKINKVWQIMWMASVLAALVAAPGWAAPPPASKMEEAPINITAAQLEADHEKQEITFSGQVIARYKDMILYADHLKIFYEKKQEPTAPSPPAATKPGTEPESPLGGMGIDKIARIEAQGHVRLVQEDKVASGEQAIYYKAEEKIVLTGNPQLWRGESNIKGDRITFFLNDNRAVVTGASQKRVEAFIVPGAQPRGGASKKLALPAN